MTTVQDRGPLRIAFVGQRVYFEHCSLQYPTPQLRPMFVDFRAGAASGALMHALAEFDPDVVLVFRPEIIPEGLFSVLRAVTIGYLTEPLPRDGTKAHVDLRERLRWLEQVDADNFDRIVSFDPLIADTASSLVPVWRSLPIPVADSLFMSVRSRCNPPRLLFLGRSTRHRETMLAPLKASHSITHIGHGLFGAPLARCFRAADIQLNLHNHPYPTFENRVCLALAAGHLVISEPLSPDHGLRAGRDLLVVDTPQAMQDTVDELVSDRDLYLDVQHAGRRQAERFRASVVYPALVLDALTDVAQHGSQRRRAIARGSGHPRLPRVEPNAAMSATRSPATR